MITKQNVASRLLDDVSTAFKFNAADSEISQKLILYEQTGEAIKYFDAHQDELSDYAYWFFLSTLWVSYTGFSDLNVWKRLFSSRRPNKSISIMKPSELKALALMPKKLAAFRVHRKNETDWIAYTLSLETAKRFAAERGVTHIDVYEIKKRDITGLFLRRGENEVILVDKKLARHINTLQVKQGED
ncbi:hypothetical protein [Weissella muntiaci]|uniref:hypothetical protein n=1 Tax=Weissella muntiaci TaxID=2508881 RepID=UPI001FEC1177|nr:hypothetical protein [Weissella muntiaci]